MRTTSARLVTLALAGAVLAGSGPQATAAAKFRWDLGKDSLKGIKTFRVLVESIRPEAERAGLMGADILADVKVKLRGVGLPVATDEEAKADHFMPVLYINVSTLAEGEPLTYSLEVSLHQMVSLPSSADTVRATFANTWHTGMVGRNSVAGIRQAVLDQVTHFINDYQEANPKAKT